MSTFTSNIPMIINNSSTMMDVYAQYIHVNGNLDVSGTTTMNALNVNDVDLKGTLDVSGASTINGLLHANRGISSTIFSVSYPSGNTNVGGTLDVSGATRVGGNLVVIGDSSFNKTYIKDLIVDGSFNVNDIQYNNIQVDNTILITTSMDISNEGTGPALKVTQGGFKDEDAVALFNAGSEGDALLIDNTGKSIFYKDVSCNNRVYVGGDIHLQHNDWNQLGQSIMGINNEDLNGNAVSLNSDGTIVAIGSLLNDSGGTNRGMCRVFKYNGNVWTQLGQSIIGINNEDRNGHSVSLNNDGTIVAIGAPFNDISGSNRGMCRIFKYDGIYWNQLGQSIIGINNEDLNGNSVSLNSDGTIVAILAFGYDIPVAAAGLCRIYKYTTDWVQLGGNLTGVNFGDELGTLSLNDDGTIVAFSTTRGSYSKIFKYMNLTWTQLGQTITENSSYMSISLNSDGTIVAIGASNGGSNIGRCRIYKYNGSTWDQLGQSINGLFNSDGLGVSVSINGDGTIVATYSFGNNGMARIFKYNGSTWYQLGEIIYIPSPLNDYGNVFLDKQISINYDGTIVAIGAPLNDFTGTNRGMCRIYEYKNNNFTLKELEIENNKLKETLNIDDYTGKMVISNDINLDGNVTFNGNVNYTLNLFNQDLGVAGDSVSYISASSGYFGGVLAPNGKIYCMPRTATSIMVINPLYNSVSYISKQSGQYLGGVLAPNGKIYCMPYNVTSIMVINPSDNSLSYISSSSGYIGGVLAPNGKIYCMPYNVTSIMVINPSDNSVSYISSTGIYAGGVLAPNGKIYGMPTDTSSIMVINPSDNSVIYISATSGYTGGVLAPNGKIYCIPNRSVATSIMVINPYDNSVSYISSSTSYRGGVLAPNGKIYCIPNGATSIMVINPSDNSINYIDSASSWSVYYESGVLAQNGKIYCIPGGATSIMVITPSPPTSLILQQNMPMLDAYYNNF